MVHFEFNVVYFKCIKLQHHYKYAVKIFLNSIETILVKLLKG